MLRCVFKAIFDVYLNTDTVGSTMTDSDFEAEHAGSPDDMVADGACDTAKDGNSDTSVVGDDEPGKASCVRSRAWQRTYTALARRGFSR